MKEEILVLVIVSTYNHSPYVAKCIQSVLARTFSSFEFLIADDGSTDNTSEIIKGFVDNRITFIQNEKNIGACASTNNLIKRSRGKYIALTNSDDFWIKDKLSLQVKFMESNLSVGAVFAKPFFVNKNNEKIEHKEFELVFDQANRTQGQWLRFFFTHGNCICHPSMLIRRECYNKVGLYDNRLRQLPDYDMWIRLVKKYPIHIMDEQVIGFRLLPGENASSQTPDNSIRTINEHFLIGRKFFDDVNAAMFLDGFTDLLKVPKNDGFDEIDLAISQAFRYLIGVPGLNSVYLTICLELFYNLLSSQDTKERLAKRYNFTELSFQTLMKDVEVFRQKNRSDDECKILKKDEESQLPLEDKIQKITTKQLIKEVFLKFRNLL